MWLSGEKWELASSSNHVGPGDWTDSQACCLSSLLNEPLCLPQESSIEILYIDVFNHLRLRIYVCTYTFVQYVQRANVSDLWSWELPCECWEMSPGSLEEQQIFLTIKPSLQTMLCSFKQSLWCQGWTQAILPPQPPRTLGAGHTAGMLRNVSKVHPTSSSTHTSSYSLLRKWELEAFSITVWVYSCWVLGWFFWFVCLETQPRFASNVAILLPQLLQCWDPNPVTLWQT